MERSRCLFVSCTRFKCLLFRECWREQHYDPSIFKNDPNGICYNREAIAPDWVLDQWHPWEKVQMMDYFGKREELKEEFNEYYEKSLTKKYQPEAPAPVV